MLRFVVPLLLVLPAFADTVTLSTGASCEAASINYDFGAKNFAVQCKGSAPATCAPPAPATTTQACPPGQTGTITTSYSCSGSAWVPTTVSACTALPPSGAYVPRTLQGQSASHREYFEAGTVYAYTMPSPRGLISFSAAPGTDGGNALEISISATPGDMSKAASGGACGGQFGVESAGLRWGVGDAWRCPLTTGFINTRMLGKSGSLDYSWNPY